MLLCRDCIIIIFQGGAVTLVLFRLFTPQEPIAVNNSVINDHLKMENKTKDGKSASVDLCCEMENSAHGHDLAHRIKRTGPSEDRRPGTQPREVTFRSESREDALAGNEMKTKVVEPKLNTESPDRKDSCMSSLRHDEVVTATQKGKAYRNATEQKNKLSPTPDSPTSISVLREDNAVDQQQISEVKAGTKEVKCVCTQTEECNREDKDIENLHQKAVIVHASTQTHGERIMQHEEEEKQAEECTDSPSLSPAPALETGSLLFSGSFPISANPAHLAERIRRSRSRVSAAYDDTEYEPYGLPEVVMKGVQQLCSERIISPCGLCVIESSDSEHSFFSFSLQASPIFPLVVPVHTSCAGDFWEQTLYPSHRPGLQRLRKKLTHSICSMRSR